MRNLLEYEEFLFEFVNHRDLDSIERYADKLFKVIGVDIEFTKHFFDRVNDARNGKPIQGLAEDLIVNQERAGLTLVFTDNTQGWLLQNN